MTVKIVITGQLNPMRTTVHQKSTAQQACTAPPPTHRDAAAGVVTHTLCVVRRRVPWPGSPCASDHRKIPKTKIERMKVSSRPCTCTVHSPATNHHARTVIVHTTANYTPFLSPHRAAGAVENLRRGQALIDRTVGRRLKGSRQPGRPAPGQQDRNGRAEHGSGAESPLGVG